ncbi:phosphatase PAP2 family protein [Phenylobacterium sp.]|uniref:acid phosphatase n=1 Tax=Phenylobacterium sp. TaxID=1871053 RepID=UPI0025D7DC0B|nr:phosphatase PAP2 family protein [Phenylobacterium sp.]MBX3484180.1 phosphatase PAP2 family protein [Phenylobacterium sp.]MCW5760805.1 phosphatase PAP2 family protein [Phenylobacterium sp.]
MRIRLAAGVAVVAASMALASTAQQQQPAPAPAPATALPPGGYLPRGAAPNSLAMIPPPPAPDSAAQARDDAAARAAQAQQSGPRWDVATLDADLVTPESVRAFSCAADVDISPATTPKLYAMMRKTLIDVGLSPYPTKTKYQRQRPFMTTSVTTICSPAYEALLRKDGSYPSGHSAIGWGWALILAEAVPDRIDPILARGRAFGQSRVVCNVHWLSDTEEGRVIAAATVAKLHTVPEFESDLAAVRTEIAAARAEGKRPTRDCAAEAGALADG